jgi:N-acetylmuramoyl-L-alanine amidase
MTYIDYPSDNFDYRPSGTVIQHLIFHYTACEKDLALEILRHPQGPASVSAHYVVDRDGAIYALVEESQRAWHAGQSFWRGQDALNDTSIGIEIVNLGEGDPYTLAQKHSVIFLAQGIFQRHGILPLNVLGHSDIAPHRKQDPGFHFFWEDLAQAGVGLSPASLDEGIFSLPLDDQEALELLSQIGYGIRADSILAPLPHLVLAFHQHFAPFNKSPQLCERSSGRLRHLAQAQGMLWKAPSCTLAQEKVLS